MAKEAKERPILFSASMVRAILENRKTQTRRVMKTQYVNVEKLDPCTEEMLLRHCPYGVPGDRLWVRETFALECDWGYASDPEARMPADGRPFKTHVEIGDGGEEWGEYHTFPCYRATEPDTLLITREGEEPEDRMVWKPSIFMPRWASRITLEIAEVRVQRVQEISEEDAKAEGVAEPEPAHGAWCDPAKGRVGHWSYRRPFSTLWDSINAKRGFPWDSNPWVWAVSFRRLG